MKMVHLFNNVRGTKDLPVILNIDKSGMLKWYIYGSYSVHPNMGGETGRGMAMGRGLKISVSIKQTFSTRSSTKLEIVGVDQLIPLVLWIIIFKNLRAVESLRISYIKTIRALFFYKTMASHQALSAPNI